MKIMNVDEAPRRLGYQKINLEDAGFRIDLQIPLLGFRPERIWVIGHLENSHTHQLSFLEQIYVSCILAWKVLSWGSCQAILGLTKSPPLFPQYLWYKARRSWQPLSLKVSRFLPHWFTALSNVKLSGRSDSEAPLER